MTAHVKSARSKLRCEFGFRSYAKQEQPAFFDQTHQHLFFYSAIYTCLLLFNNKQIVLKWILVVFFGGNSQKLHGFYSSIQRDGQDNGRVCENPSFHEVLASSGLSGREYSTASEVCFGMWVFVEAKGRMNGDFFRLRFRNSGCFEMDNFLICPFLQHEIFTMMA